MSTLSHTHYYLNVMWVTHRSMKQDSRATKRAPKEWQGGLKTDYVLGPAASPLVPPSSTQRDQEGSHLQVRLRIFNEPKMSTIYNVVAAIPGAWESDR